MSQILTEILEQVRGEYVQLMQDNGAIQPFITAENLCQQRLYIETDLLASIIEQDPALLAARAGNLILDQEARDNPCVGIIISANIQSAALEALLETAVHFGWLESNEEGEIFIDKEEVEQRDKPVVDVDYSISIQAKNSIQQPGISLLNKLMIASEKEYLDQLDSEIEDAYQLAIRVAGSHSVFSPEEIAPLVAQNPLLLGLRCDDLIIDEVFDEDPPAGIIISGHITQMMLDHLLELGSERGALACDGEGQLILPPQDGAPPVIH